MLNFINNVMAQAGPLFASEYFMIPAFMFVFIGCVCLVKYILRGRSDV